jgi:hypothetical protein
MKQEQEKTWSTSTNRTIYQWSEVSKTKSGVSTTKQTVWTQTIRNRLRQKAGEIQAYRVYEKGTEKWRKEHLPRKGKGNISAEGQELLEDEDIWGNESPSRSHIRIQKTRKIQRRRFIHVTPKRTNHIHIHYRLVPPGGTGTRAVGRMDEADLGQMTQITRPKKNTTGKLLHIPNERLDPQNHEGKRIRQMRPM